MQRVHVLSEGSEIMEEARKTLRTQISRTIEVSVDGVRCDLIDLSITGAQITAPMLLRSDQSVRLAFTDEPTSTRCHALVAWVLMELVDGNALYRAGLRFLDPEPKILETYCVKYGTNPFR